MLRETKPDAGGKEAVMEVMERVMASCTAGDVGYVAVTMMKNEHTFQSLSGGMSSLELAALGALEVHRDELKEGLKRRNYPPNNPGAAANRYFYNCLKMPLAFDFLTALLRAQMVMEQEKIPGPLHVGWYWGNNPDMAILTAGQSQCFHGLTRPLLQLVGAVEDQSTLSDGRNLGEGDETFWSLAPITEAYNKGNFSRPTLKPPPDFVEIINKTIDNEIGQKPVTITLREADHHPFRNSNLPEWFKLADWLQARGEKVVFVRDTAKCNEDLPGDYMTCKAASDHVLVRAALYQEAKANLFVANGPSIISLFQDTPWLMVNCLTPEHKEFWMNTDERGWKIATGFEPGGQWPWAKPNQRIVWSEDKFEPMRDAWLEHIA